jgi:hypothetical protein
LTAGIVKTEPKVRQCSLQHRPTTCESRHPAVML